MAVSSMSRPSLAPFHRADEESDSSYSSDSDYFLPDGGAVLGVGDDAWLPPPRSLPEQATLREPFEEQLDEEELDEGELGEGELDGGEREGLHLGIGDGSGDTDFEKALFNALVPIDTTLSPATAGARRTRERAAAPQTELSAEWVVQAVALARGSSHNPHAGSPQELALLLLRSGFSLHAAAELLGGFQQHLLDRQMIAALEDLKCASLHHIQRRLRQDVWKYTNAQQLKLTLPRPLPPFSLVFRCVGPALSCLVPNTLTPPFSKLPAREECGVTALVLTDYSRRCDGGGRFDGSGKNSRRLPPPRSGTVYGEAGVLVHLHRWPADHDERPQHLPGLLSSNGHVERMY